MVGRLICGSGLANRPEMARNRAEPARPALRPRPERSGKGSQPFAPLRAFVISSVHQRGQHG